MAFAYSVVTCEPDDTPAVLLLNVSLKEDRVVWEACLCDEPLEPGVQNMVHVEGETENAFKLDWPGLGPGLWTVKEGKKDYFEVL